VKGLLERMTSTGVLNQRYEVFTRSTDCHQMQGKRLGTPPFREVIALVTMRLYTRIYLFVFHGLHVAIVPVVVLGWDCDDGRDDAHSEMSTIDKIDPTMSKTLRSVFPARLVQNTQ
jgi:hypothetical protein